MAGGNMIDDPHGPLFSVVCTDTNPYGTWQTELLEHSWLRAGMPGELIRLVGTPNGEKLPQHRAARVIRTGATNTHPRLDGDYTGMNRLHSLAEWLERERPVGTVLILDCDFVFRAPLVRHAEPGRPIGQLWWDFQMGGNWAEAVDSITPGIAVRVQNVTWPLLIHTSDLRRIIGRWVEVAARLRKETGAWESDMVALTVVLAEYEITCDLEMLAAWMPWPDEVVADAPIIHYCQRVLDVGGDTLWYKQEYSPWDDIDVDPSDAALGYCSDLLVMLKRFAGLQRAAHQAGS
jgi:hypothetical protein